jgi:Na+-driven multidrug efflux pump
MVMMLAETVQMGVYNQTLYTLVGDVGVGTMALVIMLHDFFYFPVYGMAFGVQSITSYNLGANRWDRVCENVKMLMKSTLAWSVAVWLLMMLFTQPVVQLVIGDGAMTDYAVPMVRLSFVVFFIATLQFACQSTLQAMNRPTVTFWIGLSRTLLLLVPLVWLLPKLFSSHADASVFLAQPVTDVFVGGATILLLMNILKNIPLKS